MDGFDSILQEVLSDMLEGLGGLDRRFVVGELKEQLEFSTSVVASELMAIGFHNAELARQKAGEITFKAGAYHIGIGVRIVGERAFMPFPGQPSRRDDMERTRRMAVHHLGVVSMTAYGFDETVDQKRYRQRTEWDPFAHLIHRAEKNGDFAGFYRGEVERLNDLCREQPRLGGKDLVSRDLGAFFLLPGLIHTLMAAGMPDAKLRGMMRTFANVLAFEHEAFVRFRAREWRRCAALSVLNPGVEMVSAVYYETAECLVWEERGGDYQLVYSDSGARPSYEELIGEYPSIWAYLLIAAALSRLADDVCEVEEDAAEDSPNTWALPAEGRQEFIKFSGIQAGLVPDRPPTDRLAYITELRNVNRREANRARGALTGQHARHLITCIENIAYGAIYVAGRHNDAAVSRAVAGKQGQGR
jgi:hypothetical protein